MTGVATLTCSRVADTRRRFLIRLFSRWRFDREALSGRGVRVFTYHNVKGNTTTMLKYLLLALAVATLATQTALADSRLSGAVTTRHLYKADSTNTTVTLVSADDARVTRAAGLLLSVDASDTIKLNCGSVTKAAFFWALAAASPRRSIH